MFATLKLVYTSVNIITRIYENVNMALLYWENMVNYVEER